MLGGSLDARNWCKVPGQLPIFVNCNLRLTCFRSRTLARASYCSAAFDRAQSVATDVLGSDALASACCASVTESCTYRRLGSSRMDPAHPSQACRKRCVQRRQTPVDRKTTEVFFRVLLFPINFQHAQQAFKRLFLPFRHAFC